MKLYARFVEEFYEAEDQEKYSTVKEKELVEHVLKLHKEGKTETEIVRLLGLKDNYEFVREVLKGKENG